MVVAGRDGAGAAEGGGRDARNPERVSAEASTPSGFIEEHTRWPAPAQVKPVPGFRARFPSFASESGARPDCWSSTRGTGTRRAARPPCLAPPAELTEGSAVERTSTTGEEDPDTRKTPREPLAEAANPLGVLLSVGAGANPVPTGAGEIGTAPEPSRGQSPAVLFGPKPSELRPGRSRSAAPGIRIGCALRLPPSRWSRYPVPKNPVPETCPECFPPGPKPRRERKRRPAVMDASSEIDLAFSRRSILFRVPGRRPTTVVSPRSAGRSPVRRGPPGPPARPTENYTRVVCVTPAS